MKKNMKHLFLITVATVCGIVWMSCSDHLPEQYAVLSESVEMTPDYRDVVIPCNIAPMNFKIKTPAEKYLTCVKGEKAGTFVLKGDKVMFPLKDWQRFLAENKGASYTVEIYLQRDGQWYQCPSIRNDIAPEPVDEYLSYRIIEPSYVLYEKLWLKQRCLSNFKEFDLYNNRILYKRESTQCINCHAYQNYRTDNMQFHARSYLGGTMIVSDGVPQKVNLKTGDLISAGVYPAWHPQSKMIAYSVNKTSQLFHSNHPQKIEVVDTQSDLILYDIQTNEVQVIKNDSNDYETFPAWAPDGKTLYYASCHFPTYGANRASAVAAEYEHLHYNLFRIPFDVATRTFGESELLYDADAIGKSALLPRVSPDGKYLLFSMGDYGTFHIWHKSSDLYLMDLQTNEVRCLENVNSPDTESYHTWSSNGRWMVFSTRRDDGSYTRLYLAYFSPEGKACKAFIVPQKDPDYYGQFMKSYNIPEFMVEPVHVSVRGFAEAFKKDAKQAVMAE